MNASEQWLTVQSTEIPSTILQAWWLIRDWDWKTWRTYRAAIAEGVHELRWQTMPEFGYNETDLRARLQLDNL